MVGQPDPSAACARARDPPGRRRAAFLGPRKHPYLIRRMRRTASQGGRAMRAQLWGIRRALHTLTGRSSRLRLALGVMAALVLSVQMFPAAEGNWQTFHANAA